VCCRRGTIGCLVVVLGLLLASCGPESSARDAADIASNVGCSGAHYRPVVVPTAVQEMRCSSSFFAQPLIIDRWAENVAAKDAIKGADAWCALSPSLGSPSISLVYHLNWSVTTASKKSADVIHSQWVSRRRDVQCCGASVCPHPSAWRWWCWLLVALGVSVVGVGAWRYEATRTMRRRRADAARAYDSQQGW
jgi:hypothetical protein